MGLYKYVCEFTLNNIRYIMLMDKNNKRFFLKHMNHSYSYVTKDELFNIISNLYHSDDVYDFSNNRNKKHKILPKIIIGGTAFLLTPPLLVTSIMLYNQHQFNEAKRRYYERNNHNEEISDNADIQNIDRQSAITEDYINRYLSVAERYNATDNKLDTYLCSDMIHYAYIYDMDYLYLVYDNQDITLDDLNSVIDTNPNIPDKYKMLFHEYCNQLCSVYTDIELRPFYENLKTIKVVECDKNELLLHTLNISSEGCYVRSENVMYVPENYEYQSGTWGYQIIFHELSHCFRTHVTKINGTDVKVQCEGLNFSNMITAEALNSLFAVSLLGYNEDDIAYQLQSNYHRVILECVDNYTLSDYANHSISYYANKLDEFNNDDGYAPVILELIQMQFDDYHNDNISIEQEQFYPIYDYISNMYLNKYITDDMTYEEMKSVMDELVRKITFDVPEEYNIDIDHFYSFFENYLTEKGFSKTRK